MSFVFHPEAEIEFNAAIDYYERIELGLGYDFAIEVFQNNTAFCFFSLFCFIRPEHPS